VRSLFAYTTIGLLVASPLAGQPDRLTEIDVFDLEYASDPRISPDGNQVVYVRQFADVMTDMHYSNLWLIGADGGNHRPLTTGKYSDHSPRWSPDGSRIAYMSNRDGMPQIYMHWLETGQTAAITNLTDPATGLSWSPDGSLLAFHKLVPEAPLTIGQLPAPPAGAQWAEPAKYTDKLVFRFDGMGDLPAGYWHLFVIPAEGGTPRQLTSGDSHYTAGFFAAQGGAPEWAPSSDAIVLSANLREDWEMEWSDSEVYEISVADASVRALTDRRGPDSSPTVSPDGGQVAYLGYDDRYQGYQVTRLHVMDRDGSNARVVSGGLDRSVYQIRWAPGGEGIYGLYDDEGNTKLALFQLDGSHEVLAGDGGSGFMAYGGFGVSYTVAGDGTFAFATSRPDRPGDVMVGDGDGSNRIVTSVNADLFAGKTLGAVEEIWWESSADGRRVQGWIVKPPGFDPERKYPFILEIHGGPISHYGDRFSAEMQMFAAAGYVVLYSNPRGSTSYGEEFGDLLYHHYPGNDYDDLMSGVDAVIARGYVDEDNLFVTGGSAGGIMTAWIVGKTDRFRAAVSEKPVINWISKTLTADNWFNYFGNRYEGLPWEDPEPYWKFSPLSLVGNVTTPTMVLTGSLDLRTPLSESYQFFHALKFRGIDTAVVRIPGAFHNMSRRPSELIAKVANQIAWFEKYRTSSGN
jgi:dipeptidyl aminopeptidase/acylaminoacyl peptidase